VTCEAFKSSALVELRYNRSMLSMASGLSGKVSNCKRAAAYFVEEKRLGFGKAGKTGRPSFPPCPGSAEGRDQGQFVRDHGGLEGGRLGAETTVLIQEAGLPNIGRR